MLAVLTREAGATPRRRHLVKVSLIWIYLQRCPAIPRGGYIKIKLYEHFGITPLLRGEHKYKIAF